MAFDPHYSSSSFPNFHVPIISKDSSYLQMLYKESLPYFDDEFMNDYIMSSSPSSFSSSRTYFPEELGLPGYGSFQEYGVNYSHHFGLAHPAYYSADQIPMEDMKCGFEDKLGGGSLGSQYCPDYQPASVDNYWEIEEQRRRRCQNVEEASGKVNRYSEEERREKILKYLKKRNQRNFNKTIKYACRKTLADRRLRVRGRFAKNSEISEDEALALKNNYVPFEVNDNWYYGNHGSFQMNLTDEEWLQEAIASLTCDPHMGNNVIFGPALNAQE